MASLSNENNKGYRIQWRFVVRVGPRAGETVSGSLLLGHCTKAAAKAQLRETEIWEEAVKTGRHLPDTSWAEVTGSWLDERELTYTEQTLARAKRVLSMYERWRCARNLPVKTVDQFAKRPDLIAWRNHRLEQEAGRKTVANDLSTLAELFRWCVREKYLPDNPIDRITRPRFTIKKEGTPLTREQAGRWLKSIQPKPGRGACGALTWEDVRRKRQIAVFLLNTGIRNGELCALDIDDRRPNRSRSDFNSDELKPLHSRSKPHTNPKRTSSPSNSVGYQTQLTLQRKVSSRVWRVTFDNFCHGNGLRSLAGARHGCRRDSACGTWA